jgi:hypothetical protein
MSWISWGNRYNTGIQDPFLVDIYPLNAVSQKQNKRFWRYLRMEIKDKRGIKKGSKK